MEIKMELERENTKSTDKPEIKTELKQKKEEV